MRKVPTQWLRILAFLATEGWGPTLRMVTLLTALTITIAATTTILPMP